MSERANCRVKKEGQWNNKGLASGESERDCVWPGAQSGCPQVTPSSPPHRTRPSALRLNPDGDLKWANHHWRLLGGARDLRATIGVPGFQSTCNTTPDQNKAAVRRGSVACWPASAPDDDMDSESSLAHGKKG